MESNSKSIGVLSHYSRISENIDPNTSSPGPKVTVSPSIAQSAKRGSKSATKSPNPADSGSKITSSPSIANSASQEMACKCGKGGCWKGSCVAYEPLRASHKELFKSLRAIDREETDLEELQMCMGAEIGNTHKFVGGNSNKDAAADGDRVFESLNAHKVFGEIGVKSSRDELLGGGGENVAVAQHGSGKVMSLVPAFEKLLTIPHEEDPKKGFKSEFATGGDCSSSSSSFSYHPSVCRLTRENLGLCSHGSLYLDSSHGTTSSRISQGRKSRLNSSESFVFFSTRLQKRRQLKTTSQKPFNLRTEQRGRYKEEKFHSKLKQMEEKDKKNRIPIAQDLPWTTDEPKCLVKPPVKESTRAIDLVLHSDVRTLDRAKFDRKVAEKLSFIKQQKMERERLQKLKEEEETRRLRKELVPKAQPLPYFDRPFIPRRSERALTLPQEPKFHIPQHKIKCCNESEQGFQFRKSWIQCGSNIY